MKKLIIAFFALFSTIQLFAGPFGLEKGMTYEQVKEACGGREPVKLDEGRYMITPIKQHPYFHSYVAWIDEKEGLNYLKAIGDDIKTNGYGIEVKSKFESLENSLSKTYGKFKKTDMLLYGSIWNDPDDWMTALEKKERYLMTHWERKYNSSLPDDMEGIYLAASATSSSVGYICIEYEFSNHEVVSKAQKELEDSVF